MQLKCKTLGWKIVLLHVFLSNVRKGHCWVSWKTQIVVNLITRFLYSNSLFVYAFSCNFISFNFKCTGSPAVQGQRWHTRSGKGVGKRDRATQQRAKEATTKLLPSPVRTGRGGRVREGTGKERNRKERKRKKKEKETLAGSGEMLPGAKKYFQALAFNY